jgi:hypothetical protein
MDDAYQRCDTKRDGRDYARSVNSSITDKIPIVSEQYEIFSQRGASPACERGFGLQHLLHQ